MFEMYDHLVSNLLKYYPGKALPIEAGFNKSSIYNNNNNNRMVYYKSLSDSNCRKTIIIKHICIQTKFCVWWGVKGTKFCFE